MKKTLTLMFAAMLCCLTVPARGDIVLNEVIGSTTGADTEFIELFNTSSSTVDISGWFIEEIESDPGDLNGTVDDSWTIPANTSIASGGFYLIGNDAFIDAFGVTPDQTEALSIENSSYTLALRDSDAALQYAAFVSDSDGVLPAGITADISVGPDGTFLPAGYFLDTDGGTTASIPEFAPVPAASATPGFSNVAVPEPSSLSLLGLVGLTAMMRRRK